MKEKTAFKLLENTGEPTITHDDKLLLRGQKSEVGLVNKSDWRKVTYIRQDKSGKDKVVNYFDGREAITVEQYQELSKDDPGIKYDFLPQFERGLDLGGNVSLVLLNNQFDIYLLNLYDDAGSRYSKALDAMVKFTEQGVLRYTPRAENPTSKNLRDAIRNRLLRYVKPTEYEHNILFRGELGRVLNKELREAPEVEMTAGTVYLQGYKSYKGQKAKTKFYDIGIREGSEPGQYFKLETTIKKGYFKAEEMKADALTTQPEIQEKLKDFLVGKVATVLKLLSPEALDMIQTELRLDIPAKDRDKRKKIALEMLAPERTLSQRVDALEREQAQQARELLEVKERLERLEGNNNGSK